MIIKVPKKGTRVECDDCNFKCLIAGLFYTDHRGISEKLKTASERRMTAPNVMRCIGIKSQRNLKNKTKFARAPFYHRSFFFAVNDNDFHAAMVGTWLRKQEESKFLV